MDSKVGDVGARVAVPVRVLSAGRGVEVEDGVDALLGTEVDDAVEVLEAFRLEHAWVHVIWGTNDWQGDPGSTFLPIKMPVVERQADTVQSEAFEELGVLLLEEILQKLQRDACQRNEKRRERSDRLGVTHLVEEECGLYGPDNVRKGSADLEFATRVAGYEVLHAARGDDKPSACSRHEGTRTYFIHPPRPAPRSMTSWPSPSTILVPETFR